jgi:cobalt-zinc-cadmium efflux system outer membrane protein
MSLKPFVLVFFTIWINLVTAQVHSDSLRINLDSAEKLFLGGNFLLLAQKYNIQAQKAQEIQAKLYPNPNLSVFYSLYNTQTKKFFPVGSGTSGGELSGQLSQLVYLAGQRNKQVRIAEANTRIAEYHAL